MLTRSALTIRLHPNDDVVIARSQLVGGTTLLDEKITVVGLVPPAHKIATRAIKKGEPVRRYNQIIGFASKDIAPGEHVHLNNLVMGSFDRDYAFGADMKPTQYVTPAATFMGIVREDGRVATRNYIGILSTVNCSATVSRGIAEYFTRERLAEFPNVDGVVALTHGSGCGMDTHGEGMQLLAAHAGRLRAPCELRRRADDRPGLRGEPDQFADGRGEPEGGTAAAPIQHPGHRRHGQDHRLRHRSHQGDAAACQRREAATGAGVAHHRRPAVRRLGRLLGHHRQSVARRGGRPAGAPWRLRPFCPRRRRSTVPNTC